MHLAARPHPKLTLPGTQQGQQPHGRAAHAPSYLLRYLLQMAGSLGLLLYSRDCVHQARVHLLQQHLAAGRHLPASVVSKQRIK